MKWTPYQRNEISEKAFYQIYRRTPIVQQSFLYKTDENGKVLGMIETRTKVDFKNKKFELKEELTEINGLCKKLELRCLDAKTDQELFSRSFQSDRAWLEAEQDMVLACEE
ncbi:hypothetical protein [Caudoviricetes sp.]|nr:hypothetical protein [Caudoviricetes sp.]UOF81035.1 hypothetical protein [Caudoviricetes sp.]UOF81389.1 hypothetical protein [Caudoviricetes sp.]